MNKGSTKERQTEDRREGIKDKRQRQEHKRNAKARNKGNDKRTTHTQSGRKRERTQNPEEQKA